MAERRATLAIAGVALAVALGAALVAWGIGRRSGGGSAASADAARASAVDVSTGAPLRADEGRGVDQGARAALEPEAPVAPTPAVTADWRPPGMLYGVVRRGDGAPVESAFVGLGAAAARTNAEGRFSIALARASVHAKSELLVSALDLRPVAIPDIASEIDELGDDGVLEVVLSAAPLVLAGTAVGAEGEPLAGWRVDLLDTTHSGQERHEEVAAGRAPTQLLGEDGSFEIGGLADKAYRLRFHSGSEGRLFVTEPLRAGNAGLYLVFGHEAQRMALSGRVVDTSGSAVEGAWVTVTNRVGAVVQTLGRAQTDAIGAFRFDALPDVQPQMIAAELEGYQGRTERLEPAAFDVELVLERWRLLRVELDEGSEVRELAVLDGEGRRVALERRFNASVRRGRSGTVRVGEDAREVVLYDEHGAELFRRALPHPDDVELGAVWVIAN